MPPVIKSLAISYSGCKISQIMYNIFRFLQTKYADSSNQTICVSEAMFKAA